MKIKKLLALLLSIVLLNCTLPLSNTFICNANSSSSEGFSYTVENGEATITNYTGTNSDIIIPSKIGEYTVTKIAELYVNINTNSVYIPETVKEITNGAFRTSKDISIIVDENNPFFHCVNNCLIETKTKTLIRGNSKGLIPDDGSVTIIGTSAFAYLNDLEAIQIPVTVTHIDAYAFSYTSIKQIVIPDSVITMSGYCTFDYCRQLESVHIGKGLESFTSTYHCFSNCDKLTSITVDEANPNFNSQGNCLIETKINTLILGCQNSTIPSNSNIESIGYCAFQGCSNLRSITIPNSIKSIGPYAFSGCSSLQSIFIPKSVTHISYGVFDYCSNLSEIKVDSDNLSYHAIDNCLIQTSNKMLIQGCYNSIIPSDGSVEHIGENAFYGQQNLYYLEIPEGIKTIGYSAFCSTSLIMVSLPTTLQNIGEQNFNGMGRLRYILYNGSETAKENIINQESWEGQNSDFHSAQWYYNGNKPFQDLVLSATSVECMELIDCNTVHSVTETWIEYSIDPQIKISFSDGTVFTGKKDEIEKEYGFPVGIFTNQSKGNPWEVGTHKAKVCFLTHSVDIDVTIVEHPIEKIEIEDVELLEETSGYKTETGYFYSVTPEYTVFFKDGSKKTVNVGAFGSGSIIIKGKYIDLNTNSWSLQQNSSWTTGSSYKVSGSLLDACDTFTVTIKKKTLTNIAVVGRPNKTVYIVGEPIDISGMMVQSYYDNGYSERITDYTISGYNNSLIGEQNIIVNYNGCQTTFSVTVLPIYVTGIELLQNELALIMGSTFKLEANIYPTDATNKTIIWKSKDPSIAQIDENGVITSVKKGSTIITATTEDGLYSATCSVFVVCPHRRTTLYEAVESNCIIHGHDVYIMCDDCGEITEGSNIPLQLKEHTYDNKFDAICNTCNTARIITATGWAQIRGNWYYYENGIKVTNRWVMDSAGWCYLDENGYCATNCWKKDSSGWCYLDSNGRMVTNAWVEDSQGWCYIGADGYAVTNCWKQDSVGWCYLDSNGSMVKNSWLNDGTGWYYINANGYMVSNCWIKDSNGWCYLGSSGKMATNQWIKDSVGWCYVGADGYCVTNCWMQDSIGWCYLDSNGRMVTNAWIKDSNGSCWLDANGYWNGVYA